MEDLSGFVDAFGAASVVQSTAGMVQISCAVGEDPNFLDTVRTLVNSRPVVLASMD